MDLDPVPWVAFTVLVVCAAVIIAVLAVTVL